MYTYDGFSKVLFPISATTRTPCMTPFVLLVKKVFLKIQVKRSMSTSLEKSGPFPAKRATAQLFCHAVDCSKVLDDEDESGSDSSCVSLRAALCRSLRARA